MSHKALGAVGVRGHELRVPPFVPAGMVSRRWYGLTPGGTYEATAPRIPLHIAQSSESNDARLVSELLPQNAAFWWSGRSGINKRGSLMAYLSTPEGHVGWHVDFDTGPPLKITGARGITSKEVHELASVGGSAG